VRHNARAELARSLRRELDRVALYDKIDVEVRVSEKQIAHSPADEVHGCVAPSSQRQENLHGRLDRRRELASPPFGEADGAWCHARAV
jgi:hypothetical protein